MHTLNNVWRNDNFVYSTTGSVILHLARSYQLGFGGLGLLVVSITREADVDTLMLLRIGAGLGVMFHGVDPGICIQSVERRLTATSCVD
jgi:hypothetical protein